MEGDYSNQLSEDAEIRTEGTDNEKEIVWVWTRLLKSLWRGGKKTDEEVKVLRNVFFLITETWAFKKLMTEFTSEADIEDSVEER